MATTADGTPTVTTSVTAGPFMMFGNQIDTAVATTSPSSNSDDPLTLTGPTAHMLLHEFRLWRIPIGASRTVNTANAEIKPSERTDLVTYIRFNNGQGQPTCLIQVQQPR